MLSMLTVSSEKQTQFFRKLMKRVWLLVTECEDYEECNGCGYHLKKKRISCRWRATSGEAPREDGEEVQSPERKVIRAESEETQDHVREAAMDLSQEQVEEISFVPSAISISPKPDVSM